MRPFEHLPKFDTEKFKPQTPPEHSKEHLDRAHSFARPIDAPKAVPPISQNRTFRESVEYMGKIEEQRSKELFKKLFHSGNIDAIVDFLNNESKDDFFFRKEVQRVQKQYESQLSWATFLTPKDWRVLTAIEIFDKNDFNHSVEACHIVRECLENKGNGFAQEITNEGITPEQLFRSSLMHDVGKIAIPEVLLNNKLHQQEWVFHFMELPLEQQDEILVENKIVIPDSIRTNYDQMVDFFENKRIRAVSLVPVGKILSDKQLEQLYQLDFPDQEKNVSQLSLLEIMQLHERKSEEILSKLGYGIEAFIAGTHHNYEKRSIGAAANLLHFADVHEALNGKREYNSKHPSLRILAFLADDAEKGFTDLKTTAKWILHRLQKMSPAYLYETRNLLAKRQHHKYLLERQAELERIDEFLYDHLSESEEENAQTNIAA